MGKGAHERKHDAWQTVSCTLCTNHQLSGMGSGMYWQMKTAGHAVACVCVTSHAFNEFKMLRCNTQKQKVVSVEREQGT
jgi:hypothetical protein